MIDLQRIRTIAKRLAHAQRIPHHQALDLMAKELDHPHWNALTVAAHKGWQPTASQWVLVEGLAEKFASPRKQNGGGSGMPYSLFLRETQGSVDGHDYELSVDFEVLMGGDGWSILLEHAPSEEPQIKAYRQDKGNPILDPVFRAKALAIAQTAVEELRARISADWPRRSTKPDAKGRALHPLRGELSNKWYCLHCDKGSSGAQMAANMWHCPHCSAAPIDIFPSPFWLAIV